MFKNVKIIVLYQNIGGHKAGMLSFTLKKRVGGGVGEGFSGGTLKRVLCPLLFNIIYIICCLLSPIRLVIGGWFGGQS
jgi:hypothetical protein